MDYNQETYAYGGDAKCDRPLDNIRHIAEEAEQTAGMVRDFIIRFRKGETPETGQAGPRPVPQGHEGQLTRLRDAVADINKYARELGTLG